MNSTNMPNEMAPDVRHSGSFDEASATEQMRAIGEAMRHYFQSDDWLRARREGPAALANH